MRPPLRRLCLLPIISIEPLVSSQSIQAWHHISYRCKIASRTVWCCEAANNAAPAFFFFRKLGFTLWLYFFLVNSLVTLNVNYRGGLYRWPLYKKYWGSRCLLCTLVASLCYLNSHRIRLIATLRNYTSGQGQTLYNIMKMINQNFPLDQPAAFPLLHGDGTGKKDVTAHSLLTYIA